MINWLLSTVVVTLVPISVFVFFFLISSFFAGKICHNKLKYTIKLMQSQSYYILCMNNISTLSYPTPHKYLILFYFWLNKVLVWDPDLNPQAKNSALVNTITFFLYFIHLTFRLSSMERNTNLMDFLISLCMNFHVVPQLKTKWTRFFPKKKKNSSLSVLLLTCITKSCICSNKKKNYY